MKSAVATENYWQAIAAAGNVVELDRAIGADVALQKAALAELEQLLAALRPISFSHAIADLRWLGSRLAEAAGDRAAAARFAAVRHQIAGMAALSDGQRDEAASAFVRSAASSLETESLEEAIRATRVATGFLFRLGKLEEGLGAADGLAELVASRGCESQDVRTALYEFGAVTRHAPAGDRWATLLARFQAEVHRAGDRPIAAAFSAALAETLVRMGRCEDALEVFAEITPVLSRAAVKRADGTIAPLAEVVPARLSRAKAAELSGQDAWSEDEYRRQLSAGDATAGERLEAACLLIEFLIKRDRLQDALDLLDCTAFAEEYEALRLSFYALIYALIHRPEASAEAAAQAMALLVPAAEERAEASQFRKAIATSARELEALYEPDFMYWRIRLALAESVLARGGATEPDTELIDHALRWAQRRGEVIVEARCLCMRAAMALAAGQPVAAAEDLELAVERETAGIPAQEWKQFAVRANGRTFANLETRPARAKQTRLEAGVGIETLLALGHARSAAGQDPAGAWDWVIAGARRRNRPRALYSALTAKAQWLRALGRGSEARALSEEAVEIVETMRADLDAVESQVGMLEDKEAAFGELLLGAVEAQDGAGAMRLMERAKARALLEEVAAHSPRLSLCGGDEQEARDLRQEMARHLQAEMEGDEAQALRIETLKDRFAALYRRGEGSPPRERRAAGLGEEVRRVSENGYAVLHYFVSERYLVIAAAGDGVLAPPIRVPLGKTFFSQWLETFHREVGAVGTCPSLRELYSTVIAPVENLLAGARRLIVVPHGVLHAVPLHAAQGPDGTHLAARFPIQYAPSVAVLLEVARHTEPAQTRRVLLIGVEHTPYSPLPDLKSAVEEVQRVGEILPGAEVLIGAEGVRRRIVRRGEDLDILHLACHAEFDPDDPLLSRVYLMDGPLYGYEIERLAFRTRLAVLSACETAVHRRTAGDETFGLVRAFLSRGTEAVVASLWRVADESTSRLMHSFYRELALHPADVARAMQKAQVKMMADRDYGNPFFWAPFTVVGGALEAGKGAES